MDLSAAQSFVTGLSEKDFASEITLDAEEVTHLGALCVQAILAAARASKSAGGQFAVINIGENVESQLECMGLSAETLAGGAQ